MAKTIIENLLSTIGLPFAYRQFKPYKDTPVPDPPYIIYLFNHEEGYGADLRNFIKKIEVKIELYTNSKDEVNEDKIEEILTSYEYDKEETYIDEEELYMVVYDFEIYIKNGGKK